MGGGNQDIEAMALALALAERAYGDTSPNPLVGAVLVRNGKVIGKGWHARAGEDHAEVVAIADATKRRHNPSGATLYVTLEPCSTFGRTPPCTDAIVRAGIKRVVVAATDPNPNHAGTGFELLRGAGVQVESGILADAAKRLNEAFNHWIVHRRPFVTLKAAMTLDGKIATCAGESKWITGEKAREFALWLRRGADAVVAGVNTIVRDNPKLTLRTGRLVKSIPQWKRLRRLVLDPQARTPLEAQVISDDSAGLTTIIVAENAPAKAVRALQQKVTVWKAPFKNRGIDLAWVLDRLGNENVISVLVEGGGETNAHFLDAGLVQRACFFYAPKMVEGRTAPKGVGGISLAQEHRELKMEQVEWRKFGPDLMLTGRVAPKHATAS